ncbi:MAG: hypothetical protein JXA71_01715, partial [Chitinispirillaceae bacterium]|nr:hypothetical protein [Chitinispirillaceae bacterium]
MTCLTRPGMRVVSIAAAALLAATSLSAGQTGPYPFQNPDLPLEERIENVISLLNQTEKIQLLASSAQSVPRLGFRTTGQTEGYHGAALGGPARWAGSSSVTTQFCQAYGMGATWDPNLIER